MLQQSIFEAVEARIPSRLALARKLATDYASVPVQTMTVGNVMGGMRGLSSMLWEISGTENAMIYYHGKSMSELMSTLPKWPGSSQLSPEAMLWYLYTARAPSPTELMYFARELVRRAVLPADVEQVCDLVPAHLPPDAQVVMALSAYSHRSKFKAALARGTAKSELWRSALEDALDSAGAIPMIVARLYMKRNGFSHGRGIPLNASGDLATNFAIQMGRDNDTEFAELIRLYWATHLDHGANISAHSMRKHPISLSNLVRNDINVLTTQA